MADNQLRGAEVQDCPAIRVTQNAGCPSIRVRITGGGETPEAPLSDVNFYDYDGKRVASYTAADFAALTEMPANPSHQGLTAQGWNWSLSDARAYVAENGILDIGQMYITDDGKTRLYITIAETGRMEVPLVFSQSAANGVSVDWGDGSAAETRAGTGIATMTHTYAAPGDYVITLEVTAGTISLGGSGNGAVIGANNNANYVYSNMLLKAEIGKDTALGSAFNACGSLKSATLPLSVTAFGNNCFYQCGLKSLTVPSSLTTMGSNAINGCTALEVLSLPKGLTTINTNSIASATICRRICFPPINTLSANTLFSFSNMVKLALPEGIERLEGSAIQNCKSLTKVTIPSTVTFLGISCLSNDYGLAELHLKPTTPPTFNTNTLQNLSADCKIYVPAASLATYQGASGWSSYASQMIGE